MCQQICFLRSGMSGALRATLPEKAIFSNFIFHNFLKPCQNLAETWPKLLGNTRESLGKARGIPLVAPFDPGKHPLRPWEGHLRPWEAPSGFAQRHTVWICTEPHCVAPHPGSQPPIKIQSLKGIPKSKKKAKKSEKKARQKKRDS